MRDRCLECGFAYDSVAPRDVPAVIGAFPQLFGEALARYLSPGDGVDVLRRKPGPWAWSALEYTCHVRDVFELYADRVRKVVAEQRPTLASMRRDERAVEERYNEQDPDAVLRQLESNAAALAALLGGLDRDSWDRIGMHPTTGERPVRWMAANVVHEGRHHLRDVHRVLEIVTTG